MYEVHANRLALLKINDPAVAVTDGRQNPGALFRSTGARTVLCAWLAVLCLPVAATASANLCFVKDSAVPLAHEQWQLTDFSNTRNPATSSLYTSKDEKKSGNMVFENLTAGTVTVWCPLNIHPARPLETVSVDVVRLKTLDNEAINCALMSRSAAGGQASGRRLSRLGNGRIELLAAPDTGEANRYRYIACELPAHSAIVNYAVQQQTADADAVDLRMLIDADGMTKSKLPWQINAADTTSSAENGDLLPKQNSNGKFPGN